MVQTRKLYGIVGQINQNSILIGGHIPSVEKLKNLNYPGKSPLTDTNKFYVIFNDNTPIPSDIVGERVKIWARPRKYKFHSKYSSNKGEIVEGWKIHLVKIEKNRDWS